MCADTKSRVSQAESRASRRPGTALPKNGNEVDGFFNKEALDDLKSQVSRASRPARSQYGSVK